MHRNISSAPWSSEKTDNKPEKGSNRVFPSQPTEIFLNLSLQAIKHFQKMDWQGMAQMQKWMAQARADSASTAANDTASADSAKKSYFIECTYMHKLSEWIVHAEVSIISKHLAVCGIKHNVIYEHTELIQLALLKTPINKPQSTHATHNLITSKDSNRLELFEVGLFSHKILYQEMSKPYQVSHAY